MDINLFDYDLQKDLIANEPANPRDSCKLLVYNKLSNKITDDIFFNITKYLKKGDVLVFNNSKINPFRLFGIKKNTKTKIEVLLLKEIKNNYWEAITKGKIKIGDEIIFKDTDLKFEIIKDNEVRILKTNKTKEELIKICDKIGKIPLPPYINSKLNENQIREFYQTVYSSKQGSVASPTAGLHFTQNLLSAIQKIGVEFCEITLHVGIGTFMPVRNDDITKHKMHPEYVEISSEVINKIIKAKKESRRIIAVGTTSVRVLETVLPDLMNKNSSLTYEINNFNGFVNNFIYPSYEFKIIDGMITNFHLPKSTLLMLVCAFLGREKCLELYNYAILKKYKFYSFGDAMLLLNNSFKN